MASQNSELFICNLRQISEITFDLLLQSYIASLDAYRSRSLSKAEKEGKPRKSTQEWDRAVLLASDALAKFRLADEKRQDNLNSANTIVQEAMDILKNRYGPSTLIPSHLLT